ncbi:hypothetical protein MRB53_021009 [Persea americana]|uniref:Uncharacterized protein n=1 Tax=Persea americana TaxID=3435 RepID=A0ACC2L2I1_PERAE|nr:hypothetical protein MRB53_021009 [Persea americana]
MSKRVLPVVHSGCIMPPWFWDKTAVCFFMLLFGEPDPFYNPLNDYVILPTAFDIETHRDQGLTVNALNEDWEIISGDTEDQGKAAAGQMALVGTISVAHVKKDQSYAGTHATIVVHPWSEGKQHLELRAISVTTSG